MKRAVVGLVVLLAAGCATSDDPSKDGFFGWLFHGSNYPARVEEKNKTLDELQAERERIVKQRQQLESEVQTRQAMLDSEQARLRGLDDDLARLQQNVNQYQARTNAQQAEKQHLGQEVKRVQN